MAFRCAPLLLLLWVAGGGDACGGAGGCVGNACFSPDGDSWRIRFLRCLFPGSGVDNVSVSLLAFCERARALVILVGVWFVPVAGFLGGGELLLRSPVFRLATADLFFLSLSGKVTARSLKSIRLEFQAMAHAAVPMLGVPCREGRWIWTDAVVVTANWRPEMRKMTMRPEDSFVIFLFFGGQFVKGGVYCADVYL